MLYAVRAMRLRSHKASDQMRVHLQWAAAASEKDRGAEWKINRFNMVHLFYFYLCCTIISELEIDLFIDLELRREINLIWHVCWFSCQIDNSNKLIYLLRNRCCNLKCVRLDRI